MNSVEEISLLIEQGEFEAAAGAISFEMSKTGFNDTLAVLTATVNLAFGEKENAIAMIERGLDYDKSNYELWLMRGDFYSETDVKEAVDSYEYALRFSEHKTGEESDDCKFIRDIFCQYKKKNKKLIDDYINSCSILIYKSESICFGVLNRFADNMADSLKKLGERVEIIDVNITDPTEIPRVTKRRYKAILGIQTYLFSMEYKDKRNMHDYILGNKYNMIFDHVACMYNHLTKGPKDYIVLTHDRNYLEFAKKYYPRLKAVEMLPPAGELPASESPKEYDLSFVGSYKSPKTWDGVISELDKKYNSKASKLIDYMKKNPNETYESSLVNVFGEDVDAHVFFDLKQTFFVVMSYFREKIILELLKAGIEINVFGDSWRDDVFREYSNLMVNDELSPEECIDIYGKSLISLNIMSWHKDGRTERVANAMLAKSLVVSDKCQYLYENYTDGEDIVLFDLKEYECLPERLKKLFEGDRKEIEKMADRAYNKALERDTWDVRAEEFLKINSLYNI